MKKIIRVGIIGCGKNTRDKHVRLLQKIKGVELERMHVCLHVPAGL